MASYDQMRPVVATHNIGARLTTPIAVLFSNLKNWNDTRATRKALAQLSDHELEDIGILRGDIDDFSR